MYVFVKWESSTLDADALVKQAEAEAMFFFSFWLTHCCALGRRVKHNNMPAPAFAAANSTPWGAVQRPVSSGTEKAGDTCGGGVFLFWALLAARYNTTLISSPFSPSSLESTTRERSFLILVLWGPRRACKQRKRPSWAYPPHAGFSLVQGTETIVTWKFWIIWHCKTWLLWKTHHVSPFL